MPLQEDGSWDCNTKGGMPQAREEVLLPRNEAVQKAKIANTQSEKSLRYDNATSELHPGEEFASMMQRLSCCVL